MGNKNDYLTLEEAAQMLGRPVSVLQTVITEEKLSTKLVGGCWKISLRDYEKLCANLPEEPEKVVHNFRSDSPPLKARQAPKTIKSSPGIGSVRTRNAINKAEDLELLDAKVRNLTAQIEVRLAYLVGGKAVWNKLREDHLKLNGQLREALPKKIVALLIDLRKTKQEYILLREVDRYKRLLRSLPEWDLRRIAKAIESLQRQQGTATPPKVELIKGIEGYAGGSTGEKRSWWNEED